MVKHKGNWLKCLVFVSQNYSIASVNHSGLVQHISGRWVKTWSVLNILLDLKKKKENDPRQEFTWSQGYSAHCHRPSTKSCWSFLRPQANNKTKHRRNISQRMLKILQTCSCVPSIVARVLPDATDEGVWVWFVIGWLTQRRKRSFVVCLQDEGLQQKASC